MTPEQIECVNTLASLLGFLSGLVFFLFVTNLIFDN